MTLGGPNVDTSFVVTHVCGILCFCFTATCLYDVYDMFEEVLNFHDQRESIWLMKSRITAIIAIRCLFVNHNAL